MAFLKALQKQPTAPGYEEYVEACFAYKRACSLHSRLMRRLKGLTDPAARLQRYDAKAEFSQQCKDYQAARAKYEHSKAMQKLEQAGFKIDAASMARALGIKIPLSVDDMIAEGKKQRILDSMTQEQFDTIKNSALEYMEKSAQTKSTKQQFLESAKGFDPTLDDSPLKGESE